MRVAVLFAGTICLFSATGFAKPPYTTPIPGGMNAALAVDTSPPDPKYAPLGLAIIPNTSFIIQQTQGGSIFLGPLLGAANIEAKTKGLAKQSVGGLMGVDLPAIALQSLITAGVAGQARPGDYTIRPFGFVQQCGDDEMYRVALALDVKAPEGKNAWHGRYVAHLANPIPYAKFLATDEAQIAAFTADLTAAADAATRLLKRDMLGELPETGREVKFGSLELICNKLGGMGIYTPAKELFITKTRLIEERDGAVIVRFRSPPTMMLYGMHTMARSQVHKLD